MCKKRLHVDHPELPLRSRRADRSKLSRYVHAYCRHRESARNLLAEGCRIVRNRDAQARPERSGDADDATQDRRTIIAATTRTASSWRNQAAARCGVTDPS